MNKHVYLSNPYAYNFEIKTNDQFPIYKIIIDRGVKYRRLFYTLPDNFTCVGNYIK